MAMLKRLRRQFSGGSLRSLTTTTQQGGQRSGSGRRLLSSRLALGKRSSNNLLSSSPNSADGGAQSSKQAHKKGKETMRKQSSQNNDADSNVFTHDAAGRRILDRLITTRRWDVIGELLSTDDGREYIKSVSVLHGNADTVEYALGAEQFISIFHHIVLANPPPKILSDLIRLIGVSQLLRRDDIRPYYTLGHGTTKKRSKASRRSSNSARITHEGMAWTPLHTAVAFCVSDASETMAGSTGTNGTIINTLRLTDMLNNTKKLRVEPTTVHVLLRHFPALPSITCGKTSITPLMIEVSKGPMANMRLCKRMVDACPTSILIADHQNRTAVEYALGAENLRLYRNLHHLYNHEMQKMNGLESRKRLAHSLMAGGGGDSRSSGVDLYSAGHDHGHGGVGDVRKRREGSLTCLQSLAVKEATEMLDEDSGKEDGLEGKSTYRRRRLASTGDSPKRELDRSNRSSTSAAA